MKNTLIIGAGGVGSAVTHKCAQHNDVLGDICLASRTVSKCDRTIREIREKGNLKDPGRRLYSAEIDAKDTKALIELINRTESSLVLNMASPFCNLAILDAVVETGVDYIDTSVYEKEHTSNEPPPWYAQYEWKYRDRFAAKGMTGILGMGFDPGAVNAFCAYVYKHLIDTVDTIDIMDVNAGDHGKYFATNFDAETNLHEIQEDVRYWENGEWARIPCHSKSRTYDFPVVGEHRLYSMGHDELHSLPVNIPANRIEFWMAFSDHYINVFTVLDKLGLLGMKPVKVEDIEVEPIKVVKALLPEPSSLAAGYTGKTCIGCLVTGTKNGERKEVFIYNTCDHEEAYREIGSQAISYTTAVPAVTAALLIADGTWKVRKLVNVEELDPDPFMELMPKIGLNWAIRDDLARD